MNGVFRFAPTIIIVLAVMMVIFASVVYAADENIQCTQTSKFDYGCQYPAKSKSNPNKQCGKGSPCVYSKGTGVCAAFHDCKAMTAAGTDGKGMKVGDLGSLMQGIAKLMEALKGGAGGGGGAPPSPPGGGGGGSGGGPNGSGCAQYYQVSEPSSDPCAYFVPKTSDSISPGNSSVDAETGNSPSGPVSDLIKSIGGTSDDSTGAADTATVASDAISNPTPPSGSSTTAFLNGGQPSLLSPGLSGDIRIIQNGATIIVTSPSKQTNSIVAGFLGSNSVGTNQSIGIVQGWCRTRPWASNFLSVLIPPSFFDGLCTVRGYRVGVPPTNVAPTVSLSQVKPQTQVQAPVATTTNSEEDQPRATRAYPPPEVDIWAKPANVPLGTRTTIFWSSQNAVTCLVTSPDGSFSHTTLSGGGATVPISGPTTFTISCDSPDGTHATDFVTVGLTL